MSPFFIKAIQFFLSLSILIILHELGHFIPAKIFKVKVEKFFLFFDVKFALFKKKIGDTVYGMGWLPLGGYVKIAGMIDESMDREQMALPPEEWEYRSKPAWQRLIIISGGVTVNIVLGFVIFMMIVFVWGTAHVDADGIPNGFAVSDTFKEMGFEDGDRILKVNGSDFQNNLEINKYMMLRDVENVQVLHQDGSRETISIPKDVGSRMWEEGDMQPFVPIESPVLDSVTVGSPAQIAGLEKGDSIVSVNQVKIGYWHEFSQAVSKNKDASLELVYERDGQFQSIKISTDEEGQLGVISRVSQIQPERVTYTFGESIHKGFSYGYWTLRDYVAQFKYVFTKKGATQVGGFGAIGGLFPDVWNWQGFWGTTAFISIILAFMNILPIPVLDGGHMMFLLYEMISGRKPNEKFLEYAQMVGFFILIALVLFANGNDVYRWLFE